MNRFDRILWRINGVFFLILLAFLLVLILSNFFFNGPFDRTARKNVPPMTNGASNSGMKERLQPGSATHLSGTPLLRIPIHSEESFRGSSFSSEGEHAHTRNLLFLDWSDLSSWWLFEKFDRAIAEEHDLRAGIDGNNKRIIGTIFEVATADTNGDLKITEDDRRAAFISGADGKKPIEIIPACDRFLSVDQVTNDQVLIVYQRGSDITAALFSTHDGTKIKDSPLPINK